MKASDQKKIMILGKLQALHSAMNTELPEDKELREKFFKAKRLLFEVLDKHWDDCNKLLSDPYA
ncbi:hypothetical protein [Endozoicomonas sp.]|uniref:hypothetical protein n=1 Tax=Endozoicomonas sp. TaxID=1892382 RepID=UPI00383A65B4